MPQGSSSRSWRGGAVGPRLGRDAVRRSCGFLGTLPLALCLGPVTSLPPARGDVSCWAPEPRLLRKAGQRPQPRRGLGGLAHRLAGRRRSRPGLVGGGGDTLYLGGVLWEALVADEARAGTSVCPWRPAPPHPRRLCGEGLALPRVSQVAPAGPRGAGRGARWRLLAPDWPAADPGPGAEPRARGQVAAAVPGPR